MSTKEASARNTGVLALFSFSLFLSAALMFALQPMIGKMLLPLVGGTPAGWVVAMAFFQICLLLGYLLAHGLSLLSVRLHGIAFAALLGIGFLFLPVRLQDHADILGATPGPLSVLVLLTLTVAVPFIALSTSAPTLQRIFGASDHPMSGDPYFLYAASNLGSFIGLFSYPLLVERFLSLSGQAENWRMIFAMLGLAAVFCLLSIPRRQGTVPAHMTAAATEKETVSWPRRLRWLFLSFVPSSLMLGVTTHISTDVVSAPMMWVIPLGIYLLTFILVFSPKNPVSHRWITDAHPIFVALTIGYMTLMPPQFQTWSVFLLHLAAFAVTAMLCHRELAESRPKTSRLTEFYLFLSIGGALGGVLNAFIAPVVVNLPVEYPAILLLSCLANPRFHAPFRAVIRQNSYQNWFIMGCVCLGVYAFAGGIISPEDKNGALLASLMLVGFVLLQLHPRLALICGALTIFYFYTANFAGEAFRDRNFFGILRVFEKQETIGDRQYLIRFMTHGTTTHGLQIQSDPEVKNQPVSYYTHEGPVGSVFGVFSPMKVGVIGLGTGNIACHMLPGRSFTFYEIDPVVVRAAQEMFTFLSDCSPGTRIVLGDARLELEREKDTAKYDLLVLDAFSADMIPVHLLTREAFEVYVERTNPGGIILLHLSNRFLDLEVEASSTAALLGLKNMFILDLKPRNPLGYPGKWMALARPGTDLTPLQEHLSGWAPFVPPADFRPWTDDYSNFLSVIRFKL